MSNIALSGAQLHQQGTSNESGAYELLAASKQATAC
jgi:hypothetical protein